MKTKAFDCVEMKREGALRIHEETKDMTFEEKVAYWEKKDREFVKRMQARKEKPASSDPGTDPL